MEQTVNFTKMHGLGNDYIYIEAIKGNHQIDEEKNNCRGKEVEISTPDSKVKVYVVPTNEELMIARETKELVK